MIYVMPVTYLILQYWTVGITLCNADFIRFPCLFFTDILGDKVRRTNKKCIRFLPTV
jgi:hypothetical protein